MCLHGDKGEDYWEQLPESNYMWMRLVLRWYLERGAGSGDWCFGLTRVL